MSDIVLDGVSKVYPGGNVRAVDQASLAIPAGEFMVLVGPSGCGKSTLLRMIAGLEEVSEGVITIGGRDVTHLAPQRRDIAMVFQNYALYPHMTVRRNLAYGLRVRKLPKAEIEERVTRVATILGLEAYLDRRPGSLSGGQRQRVAMGRAIAREPVAYLMDEPLSNLDAKLRVSMRAELSKLHQRLATTTVYVTHDQIEAMTLGQRVTVMRNGVIQQVGPPQSLFHDPENLFVAAFIGSPSMNLVEAVVEADTVSFAGLTIPLTVDRRPHRAGRLILGIRPSDLQDARFADASLPAIEAEATLVEELGAETHIVFLVDAPPVTAEELTAAAEGEDARLLAGEARSAFTATVDPRSDARQGATVRLAVDPRRFHFFDPATGQTLRRRG